MQAHLFLAPIATSIFGPFEFELQKINWDAIAAIAAIASAVVGVYAVVTIKLAKQQLQFQSWLEAQKIFTNSEFTEARTKLFTAESPLDLVVNDPSLAEYLCRRFDELAWLSPYLGKLVEAWDKPVLHAWILLEKFVRKKREDDNWPQKWFAFEKFAKEAKQRLDKSQPELLKKLESQKNQSSAIITSN
jgi:hypothetical protein